jgi:hypothetical protein
MIVSYKYKFIYLAPPKTGTTTMKAVLFKHYAASISYVSKKHQKVVPVTDNPRHSPHIPCECSDYFIFATVRNPYARFLSEYCYWSARGAMGKLSFEEYLCGRLKGWVPRRCRPGNPHQHVMLAQHDDYLPPSGCIKYKVNAFVRVEHLESDFAQLPFVEHMCKFPKLNKKSSLCKPMYTQRLADLVVEKCKKDFEMFGYEKQIPKEFLDNNWCSGIIARQQKIFL